MEDIIQSFYSLIASSSWTTLITEPVYPADFKIVDATPPFLKVSIILSKSSRESYNGMKEINGIFVIFIFYKAGIGQLYASALADKLDVILQDIVINNNTVQIGESSLQYKGIDPDDKTLARADYSVPFKYFGEI
jgi:hypothetical protein